MPGQAAGDSPGCIAPILATPAAGLPPDAAEFVAEVKWDGLRACIAIAGERGPGPVPHRPRRHRRLPRARRHSRAPDPGPGPQARRPVRSPAGLHRPASPMRTSRRGAGLLAAVPVTLIIFDVLRSGRDHLTGSPYVLRRALLEDLDLQVPAPCRCRSRSPEMPRRC